jgi:hypothetical protein
MTELRARNKVMKQAARSFAKPLRDVAGKIVGQAFTRQGFVSAELVTRWSEIVGPEIAAHCEPIKLQWQRPAPAAVSGGQEPGTLVLRVEGPAAIEIQHLANVICERVNRFVGWRSVARIALRQAPLRRGEHKARRGADSAATARIAATLPGIADDGLKQALARLGAAIKKS